MKFFVNVRYNTCQPVPLEVDRIATILTLKEKIGTRYQLPVDEIRVIFQGRELSDNVTFEVRNQFTTSTALIFLYVAINGYNKKIIVVGFMLMLS